MTCGFRTSAGTDLDDLFYSDYKNPGALGFKQSDGWDLGNKYTDAAALGYSVGYKASSGTDIGYLRGSMFIPSIRPEATVAEATELYRTTINEPHIDNAGGENDSDYCSEPSMYYLIKGVITINPSSNWPQSQTVEAQIRYQNTHSRDRQWISVYFVPNTNELVPYPAYAPTSIGSGYVTCTGSTVIGSEVMTDLTREGTVHVAGKDDNNCIYAGDTTEPVTLVETIVPTGTTPVYVAYVIQHQAYNNSRWRVPHNQWYQVRLRVKNEAGTSDWSEWTNVLLFT